MREAPEPLDQPSGGGHRAGDRETSLRAKIFSPHDREHRLRNYGQESPEWTDEVSLMAIGSEMA